MQKNTILGEPYQTRIYLRKISSRNEPLRKNW